MRWKAIALLLESEDHRVLMQLRDDHPSIYFPNHWSLFTGRVREYDKSTEDAIRREIGEELKVITDRGLRPYEPRELTLFHEGVYKDATQDCDQHVFASPLHAPLDRLVLNEGQRIGLFDIDEIRRMDNIAANYKEIIESYFSKKCSSP